MTKILPTPIARCRRRFLQWTRVRPGPRKPINASNLVTGSTYLIDIEHAIVVDVEATPARTYDEVAGDQDHDRAHRTDLGIEARQTGGRHWHTAQESSSAGSSAPASRRAIPVWDKSDREDGYLSRAATSRSIVSVTFTCVPRTSCSRPLATSAETTSCAILRLSATVTHVSSSRDAVQKRPRARSHATSTRMLAIMRVPS